MESFGKYRVISKIGEGGFGSVYLGEDPHLKRQVAIKTCDVVTRDEDRKRFFREAEISAKLQHPNITTVYEFGFEGDRPFFVQEYLTGLDLSDLIDSEANLPLGRRVEILLDIATALDYAHLKGVVHRDVKPANIRVQDDGSVKIMDFGIARITESDTKLTKTGFSVGTAAYLAPEQIEGEVAGPQSDIFAFGLVAHELIAFRRAFKGPTVSALMYQILHVEPEALSELDPECPRRLDGVVRGCLAKDKSRRYRSFSEVRLDLMEIARELGVRVDGSGPIDPTVASTRVSHRPPTGGTATERFRSDEATRVTPRRTPSVEHNGSPGSSGHRLGVTLASVVVLVAIGFLGWNYFLSRGQSAEVDSPPDLRSLEAESLTPQAAPEVGEDGETESLESVGDLASQPSGVETSGPPSDSVGNSDLERLVGEAESRALDARLVASRAGAETLSRRLFEQGESSMRRARGLRTKDPQGAIQGFWDSRDLFAEARVLAAVGSENEEPAGVSRGDEVALPEAVDPTLVVVENSDGSAGEDVNGVPDSGPVAKEQVPSRAASREDPDSEVLGLLEAYEQAYESRSEDALLVIWPSIDSKRLENIARAFSQYRTLSLTVSGCEITLSARSGQAVCRVRQVAELVGGQKVDNESETTFELSRSGDRWVITNL